MNQVRRRVLALIKTGAFIQAVTAAAEFTRRNPDMAESYGLLSLAEEIAGYTRAAIKTVSHAIALAPHEAGYRFQRGRLHLKINDLSAALDDLNTVIEMEKQQGDYVCTEAAIARRDEALERQQARRVVPRSGNHSFARSHLH